MKPIIKIESVVIKDMGLDRKELEKTIGMKIPSDCKIIGTRCNCIEVKRPDGLKVFLSPKDSKVINHIRLNCIDKKRVILAVGIYRGMQICSNYAKSYAPELDKSFKKMLTKLELYKCIEDNYDYREIY